ncbi:hypothetical protein CEXT_358411 [Caerostris extrusa]|uniref:Uncharacterized protein n=1 Tax=Caerostris extrusa TaxID=172846 RepID=A0AAV4QKZ1_CAEEX|nr:hypothetical protein CEXT_358411 [Caerostris extrusa]
MNLWHNPDVKSGAYRPGGPLRLAPCRAADKGPPSEPDSPSEVLGRHLWSDLTDNRVRNGTQLKTQQSVLERWLKDSGSVSSLRSTINAGYDENPLRRVLSI